MPPYAGPSPPSHGFSPKKSDPNIITINVGGHLFQTTPQTLALAGPKSLLSSLSNTPSYPSEDICIPFIDRDPDLFSILLSLLRTGNLPSKAKTFDIQDLISEADFYNLQPLLISSLSNPSQFDAFNLEKSAILHLNGRDSPSAVATTPYGSVHVAHGSKITSFDWSLRRKSTILTQFAAIDSLLAISPLIAAAGATDFSGLQILDLERGFVKETLSWENQTRSSSTVQAIGASPEFLFTSFESGRRNSNSIMVFDLSSGSSFQPIAEIGRGEIYGAELDTAIPATKLEWVPGYNLLMASGSHGGPSGLVGNIRLWDIRSTNVAWELKERIDCFSDVTVSNDLNSIFKVGVNSGEVFMADLRKLSSEDPWICLGDVRKVGGGVGKKEGSGCRIGSNGTQVFCTKGGDLEMWSEVLMGPTPRFSKDDGKVFRRNVMGRVKDMGGCRITHMGFGGNRMVLARKDQQAVEVWQSSASRV
ncbi:BTB/POZ domain-containing protein At5g41330-like [Magnolia sinica]|uniref:BTB/POZ domain-containing protein At5g41330-like n=1 Tax=Magnolia sinica TaxID=86752 RepID=UPI00265B451D|nr:BTB/POZ domain-containing protein At5g41330-like [Magnolia sinica]